MRLRAAKLSDAAAVARVHHQTWVSTLGDVLPASFWQKHTLEDRVRTWQRWLLLGGGPPAVLAQVDDEVVGVSYAAPPRAQHGIEPVRDLQLWMLYVLEEHHGTGVGQALLDAVVPPGAACQLWVAEDNPRARRFYGRNGFAADGTRLTDEDFGGITEIRMVR